MRASQCRDRRLCPRKDLNFPDIEREVPGTKGNPPDPGTRRQNLVYLGEATRRFDDRNQIDRSQLQPMLSFELRKKPVDRCQSAAPSRTRFALNRPVLTGV